MKTNYLIPASLLLAAASAAAQQAPIVKEAPLRAHLSFLADDLLEGRGTGQRGGDLAVRYLETQAAAIGLQPLADGSYRQPVKFQGTRLQPGSSIRFAAGASTLTARVGEDVLIGTGSGRAEVLFDAPLVFVGYGAIAPGRKLERLQGRRRQGQDPGHDGQRSAADRRRAEPLCRQRVHLLRPLDVQIRGSAARAAPPAPC